MAGIRRNSVYTALSGLAERHKLDFHVEQGGKHLKFVVVVRGNEHRIVFPQSPSDWRAPKQARAVLRRIIENRVPA